MGTLSNYATTKLVDHVFKTAYTPVATLHLALCTAAPTVASTGSTITEADFTNYARKSFTTASTFGAAASRKVVQSADIEFAQAGGVSGSAITHWAIVDAASNGNMLAFGSFSASWNTVDGNTPKVASAQIEISIGASSGAGFSDVAAHLMLDLMFRTVAWSTPSASIYWGLTTATLSDTSTSGTEPSGNAYARKAVPAASFDAAASGVTTNNAVVTFATPTGSWGTIVSMIVTDALTAGNLLGYDNTNITDQAVTTDDTVQFAAGAFDVDLD